MDDVGGSFGGSVGPGPSARVGVFVCHCGGNISDVVDVGRVAEEAKAAPGVVYAATHPFMCSDLGQAQIEEAMRAHGLDRVVVAACSPSLHETTFRRCVARAGLNPFLFEHVNVREQVSWVVEDHEHATRKAGRLIRAAAAKSIHLVPLQMRRIPIHRSALVIGGGVAGLVATRNLAKRGMRVTLLERSPFLGGRMAQLGRVFPTGEEARDLLAGLVQDVVKDPLVTIHTNAEVVDSKGIVGDFRTRIRLEPRGVDERLTYAGNAMAACPEETISEFNFGLSRRKAIYMPHSHCWPAMPAIDWRSCTRCGKCVAALGGRGIALDEKPREIEVQTGVIILATGYDPYEPLYGEYGYEVFPEVVTLQQMVRLLDPEGPTAGHLPQGAEPVRSVAFIHCAGARQHQGVDMPQPNGRVNDYCARTCCTGALHAAAEIKRRWPGVEVFDIYQDIRTYGRGHEDYYEETSREGVIFLRFDPFRPPRVERDMTGQARLLVRVRDRLTGGAELEIPADLVVLATGVVPHDISNLVDLYKCAVGFDSFLLEVHPKLRPVELAVSGVFLAGACQGPMDITECSAAASAAACKAAGMISQGQIELDPFIAHVQETLCSGCQTCLTVCPYDALRRDPERRIAEVNEALCTGCGTCAAACPSGAILQYGFGDRHIRSQIDEILGPARAAGS